MSNSSIQFHKVWVDQCEAAEGIRESFGLKDALAYLIGEKLFHFVQASEERPEFAAAQNGQSLRKRAQEPVRATIEE